MSDLWIKSPVGSNRKLRKKLSFLYLINSRDLSVKMDRVCWASWISPLAGVIISPLCQALSVRVFFFSAVMYGLSIAIKYLLTLFFGGLTKGDRRGLSPQSILSHLLWQAALWGDCGEHCLLNCEHFPLHSTSYLFEWPKIPISMIKKIANFTLHGTQHFVLLVVTSNFFYNPRH